MNLNRAFEFENGLSFGKKVFIFEGTDIPETTLAPAVVTIGSVYIRYTSGAVHLYQKKTHSPLTYDTFGAGGSGAAINIDGGNAYSIYGGISAIDGGNAYSNFGA